MAAERATERSKAVSKNEVELVRAENMRVLIERGCDTARWIGIVCAAALPIWAVSRIIAPLAGVETVADIKINVALNWAFSTSIVVNGAQMIRGSARKKRLKKQRERIRHLEGRLGLPSEDA